jgi:prevent-host-death family protein
MRQIGVRELKASLSEVLRAVSLGEQVQVTRRGRVLADIVPAGAAANGDRLRELVEQGRLMPPARPRPARAPRLIAASSASAIVLADRDAER